MDLQGKVAACHGWRHGMGKAIAKLLAAGQHRRRQLLPLRGRGHRDGQGARDHPRAGTADQGGRLVGRRGRGLGRADRTGARPS